MSLTAIFIVAAGAVLAFMLLVEALARIRGTMMQPGNAAEAVPRRAGFISTVVLGKDGRTSTSKTFIFMWTLLIGWALIALVIAGELIHTHACVPPSDVANAAHRCKATGDEVGLLQVGWLHFLHTGLSGSYLVLLGVPAAAGVAAKGITQSEVNGTGFKTPNTKPGADPVARITEIFSADDGTTDIGDFQYMIFNVITAVYFVAQFVHPDGSGLPTIPDTLLGLTGVSAGLYVGKKAVTRTQPSVTGVFPQPLQANKRFTIIGEALTAEAASPTEVRPQVTIDGVAALSVQTNGTSLTAVVPPDLAGVGTTTLRHLQVKNPYDGITPSFGVQCG